MAQIRNAASAPMQQVHASPYPPTMLVSDQMQQCVAITLVLVQWRQHQAHVLAWHHSSAWIIQHG